MSLLAVLLFAVCAMWLIVGIVAVALAFAASLPDRYEDRVRAARERHYETVERFTVDRFMRHP